MKLKGIAASSSAATKALILIGICLVSVSLFSAAGYWLAGVLCNLNPFADPALFSHLGDPDVVEALKIIQAFSAIGLFIVPPLVFAWLTSLYPFQFLSLNVLPSSTFVLLFLLLILASTPFINYLFFLNQGLDLPSLLQPLEDWMKGSEENAAELTEAFLLVSGPDTLIINLIVIALLPAIGEELLFRGVLQKMFASALKNEHAAVAITAIIFSAFHMQFYGFLPRLFLGVILGYALVWSRSLWLPVIIHFFNNASAVIFAWIAQMNKLPFDQDTIGSEPGDRYVLIASIVVTAGALLTAWRQRKLSPAEEMSQ